MSRSVSLPEVILHFTSYEDCNSPTQVQLPKGYESIVTALGVEFWVQFAVSIKEALRVQGHLDGPAEKIIIDFLKTVVHKDGNHMSVYVKQTFKELFNLFRSIPHDDIDLYTTEERLKIGHCMLKFKCSSCLVFALSLWRKAPRGKNFQFTPPDSWFVPVSEAPPLESFIRSRWGGFRNIDDILGVRREELGWWKVAATKGKAKAEKKEPQPGSSSEGAAASTAEPTEDEEQKNSGTTEFGTREIIVMKTPKWVIPEPKVYDFFDYERDYKVHRMFRAINDQMKQKLDLSMIPILKSKFYKINIAELVENDSECEYLKVTAWLVNAYGIFKNKFLRQLLDFQKEYMERLDEAESLSSSQYLEIYVQFGLNWLKRREPDLEVVQGFWSRQGTPDLERDCAESLCEFLLEPCVLIQLPWNSGMLRQWLWGALYVAMSMELEMVEFRHMPVPPQAEQALHAFFSIVTDLKERILLGWTLASYEVTLPQSDPRYKNLIYEKVVFPSIESIKFLTSQMAVRIVNSLRSVCFFDENVPLEGKIKVPRSAYLVNGNLAGFATLFYGSYAYWHRENRFKSDLFPTQQHTDNEGFYYQLHLVENEKNRDFRAQKAPFELNLLSVEEHRLLNLLHNARISEDQDTVQIQESDREQVVEFLHGVVVRCGHFSMDTATRLLEIFEGDFTLGSSFMLEGDVHPSREPIDAALVASQMLLQVQTVLRETREEKSSIAAFLRLTARAMAREQMYRILASCVELVGECPRRCSKTDCPLQCLVKEDLKLVPYREIVEHCNAVRSRDKNQTQSNLFKNFPEAWREPIGTDPPPVPSLEEGIPAVVAALETRIGRLLWHISSQSMKIHGRKQAKFSAYPHTLVVQFLLPCHVSVLLAAEKLPKTEQQQAQTCNLVLFLSSLVKYYEDAFHQWVKESLAKFPNPDKKKAVIPSTMTDLKRELLSHTYSLEAVSHVLHGFTGAAPLGESDKALPHFSVLMSCLASYLTTETNPKNSSPFSSMANTAWLRLVIPHYTALHEVCFSGLGVPTPGAPLPVPELRRVQVALTVLQQVELVHQMNTPRLTVPGDREELDTYRREARRWRDRFYSLLFDTQRGAAARSVVTGFLDHETALTVLPRFVDLLIREFKAKKGRTLHRLELPNYGSQELRQSVDKFYTCKMAPLNFAGYERSETVSCSRCGEEEKVRCSYRECRECVEQSYPRRNHFCTAECQDLWWEEEHHAEHLEFELGLGEFAHLSVQH